MAISPSLRPAYDAVIIGARPAGAATALLLARHGAHVLAVDKGRYGSDALSTHALLRVGVAQLQQWGVLETLRLAGTPVVRTTTFHYGTRAVTVPIKPKDGIDGLYAPRRTLLDATLVDAARGAGADVRHHTRLVDLLRAKDGRITGVVLADGRGNLDTVRSGLVVGADGVRSSVAELVGAETYRHGAHAAATIYGYWSGLADEGYEYYFDHRVAAGVFPTNGGACVFVAMSQSRFLAGGGPSRAMDLFAEVVAEAAPSLRDRLERATRVGGLRSFAGTRGHFRHSHGPGWALVGDAGYFKDPVTAHGISDGLRDAELLARAIVRGAPDALDAYQATRDRVSAALFDVTDRIAAFDWDPDGIAHLHLELSDSMRAEMILLNELRGVAFESPLAGDVQGPGALPLDVDVRGLTIPAGAAIAPDSLTAQVAPRSRVGGIQ